MYNLQVFHGTGPACLDRIIERGLEVRKRRYAPRPHQKRKAACVTTDRAIAELFAIRKTPSDDFMAGKLTGLILEFLLYGREGSDYIPAVDPTALQDESELLVFSAQKLQLRAVWRSDNNKWTRETVGERFVVPRLG